MSQGGRTSGAVASGLVRVTVTSGTRRVDLVLPGAVPVAELLPELARSVGLLDPAAVHGGYRVGTADGRRLPVRVVVAPQSLDTDTSGPFSVILIPRAGQFPARYALIQDLPFDPTSLEGLSEKLLRSHHANNYSGAVKRLNALVRIVSAQLSALETLPPQHFAQFRGYLGSSSWSQRVLFSAI